MTEKKRRTYHPLTFSKESVYLILPANDALNRDPIYFFANSTSTIKLSGISKWDKSLGKGKRFKAWLEEVRKIINEYYWAGQITMNQYQDALETLDYEKVMEWFTKRRVKEVYITE